METKRMRTDSAPLRIALFYLFFATIWILFSDRVALRMTGDTEILNAVQSAKGWLFVATTAVLLYWLVGRAMAALHRSNEHLARANRALRMLTDSNQVLIRGLPETEALQRVCDITAETGGYRFCWVGTAHHDQSRTIRAIAHAGYESGYLQAIDITWADTERGQSPIGVALRTGQRCVVRNIAADPAFALWREASVKRGYASVAALPVTAQGESFGALSVYSNRPNAFDDEEVALLAELAGDLGVAISHSRLIDEQRKTAAELTRLNRELEQRVGKRTAALKESRNRYRSLFHNIPAMIYRAGSDWSTAFVINSLDLCGYAPAAFRRDGLNWANLIHKEDKARVFEEAAALNARPSQIVQQYRITTREGGVRWVEDHKSSRFSDDGAFLELDGVVFDISARKAAEQERDRFFNASIDMLCIAGFDGYFKQLNPAWTKTLGWTESELTGKPWLEFVHPEDREATVAAGEGLAEGRPTLEFENRYRCKEGGYRWVSWNAFPLTDRREILAVVRDVSERKQTEERIRGARDAAEAANQAKSLFLANMSHELRTPLNAIIGFSEVLEQAYFGPLNDKQAEYVKDISGSGRHLLSLINDVLDLSKIEAGKLEPEWSRVNVGDLLSDSLVLIKEKCFRHGIQLQLDVVSPAEGLAIVADERRLKQVLYNLLSNASKFTPDGGCITVSAVEDDGKLVVSVTDTGDGIALEEQSKIFEAFYQVHGGSRDKTVGTGLGLPLVSQFVAMHGGRVWVESAGLGCGSRFCFRIPLDAAAAEATRHHTASREISGAASLADAVDRAVRAAKEARRPFTICALEVEGPADVNDMARVEESLRAVKRDYDIVIPGGTDPLSVILLLDCRKDDGQSVCARFREKLSSALAKDVLWSMAAFPDDGETAEALLNKLRIKKDNAT